ncbi:MAG: tetratricopeptide repeat protein [Verrucomicrobiota bacterium]
MSRRHKKNKPPAQHAHPAATPTAPARAQSTRRTWLFRLLALFAAPLLCLLLLELGLRIAGFGVPTAFLIPVTSENKTVLVQNNRFGWRFFGPQLSRLPYPVALEQPKPPDTVRVFVFGESAAGGDTEPAMGLSHMLEVILSLRHPGVKFEVENVALTAINSHGILPIARDCARADGDIWVVYMGNNEVVGPFGAGTVFGSRVPPLPVIRATLALKATRIGQLLDSLRRSLQKPAPGKSEWGGMKMFLDQQVRSDDPRLQTVYQHFDRNLADIVRAGRNSGAGIVLSTVAVNLKDCAPLGSSHRPGLAAADLARWQAAFDSAARAQAAGSNDLAAAGFAAAAAIDDTYAELQFRQGQLALAAGQTNQAQHHFDAALELDTLRFRCDARLNDSIRRAAGGGTNQVRLADADRRFRELSAAGLPGRDLFYEHVHLTFTGNYYLALLIAEEMEALLPKAALAGAPRPWPTEAECARRMAWTDWNEIGAVRDYVARISEPPFTSQANHPQQLEFLQEKLTRLAPAEQPLQLAAARKVIENAVAAAPEDAMLYDTLASLRKSTGDTAGAVTARRRLVQLLPGYAENWWQLGQLLAEQQQWQEALACLKRGFELSEVAQPLQDEASVLAVMGRYPEAARAYRRALELEPHSSLTRLGLAKVLEASGQTAEAEQNYRIALANCPPSEAAMMSAACRSRGWFEAAATNALAALQLNPSDRALRVTAGESFEALGRYGDAAEQYRQAVQLAPDWAEGRVLYGTALGEQGKLAEATAQLEEAVRLNPALLEARLNLGIALAQQGRKTEALAQFEEVLRLDPSNATAQAQARNLRGHP